MKKLIRFLRRNIKPASKSLQDRFPQFEIGVGSYGPIEVLRYSDNDTLSIGKYCSFAKGVTILLGGEHRKDWVTTYPFSALRDEFAYIDGHPQSKGPVRIENDVWICHGATILSGTTIGSGAIVGARSVVSGTVPPYGIVVGNPASIVGFRFDAQTIEKLLNLKWWDWPQEEIDAAMESLLSDDISLFLERYGNSNRMS